MTNFFLPVAASSLGEQFCLLIGPLQNWDQCWNHLKSLALWCFGQQIGPPISTTNFKTPHDKFLSGLLGDQRLRGWTSWLEPLLCLSSTALQRESCDCGDGATDWKPSQVRQYDPFEILGLSPVIRRQSGRTIIIWVYNNMISWVLNSVTVAHEG